MKKIFFVFTFLLVAAACSSPTATQTQPKYNYNQQLEIGNKILNVEVANTNAEMEQGLSDRPSMEDNQGMLFDFTSTASSTSGTFPAFWMKDMKFPIDILWANENGIIVTIEHDVPPSSYPQSFYPSADSSYVLELPAGYTQEKGIAIGQQIVVK